MLRSRAFPDAQKSKLGSGLFCTVEGKHTITFGQKPFSEWTSKQPRKNSPQEKYGVGPAAYCQKTNEWFVPSKERPGEKKWFVPTELSISTGLLHHGFKVQHTEDGTKATHELLLHSKDGYYFLNPRRATKIDEEFCYNYGLHL